MVKSSIALPKSMRRLQSKKESQNTLPFGKNTSKFQKNNVKFNLKMLVLQFQYFVIFDSNQNVSLVL
jgi:hypothetical protein